MLNRIVVDKLLPPELRLLHNLKVKVASTYLRQRLLSAVRDARKMHRVVTKDRLAEKLSRYGNSGGWYKAKKAELAKHRPVQFIPVDLETDSFPPPEKHGKFC